MEAADILRIALDLGGFKLLFIVGLALFLFIFLDLD